MKRFVLTVGAAAMVASLATAVSADQTPTLNTLIASRDWLNGQPTAADLRGKVVLVDFYTFGCINCKHVQPNLRALHRTTSRADLAIISVHSPETAYEHDRSHLVTSLSQQGVVWPVAIDNDFAIWNAYGVQAWPTQLIFDRHGVLRATIVGEGQDAQVDSTIARLAAAR